MDAAFPSVVGASASPLHAKNESAVLQASVAAENDMGVSDTAPAPTFEQLIQAPANFNAQPVQAPEINAWPADPAAAMNELPMLAPEAATVDIPTEPAPDVLVHASAQAIKTTEQRLNAMDEKISLILGVLEQIQQNKSAAAKQLPPESLVVPAVQQQPQPEFALQPTVMLTPLAIPTTAVSKPAPSNPAGVRAKPVNPPFGVNPGEKAPHAMADIMAYQTSSPRSDVL